MSRIEGLSRLPTRGGNSGAEFVPAGLGRHGRGRPARASRGREGLVLEGAKNMIVVRVLVEQVSRIYVAAAGEIDPHDAIWSQDA